MTYIKNGRVVRHRSNWRLSRIPELFWALVNFIAVFFQTLISTEATEKVIKEGQSKGYTLQKRRPVGQVGGPGGTEMGDLPMGGG